MESRFQLQQRERERQCLSTCAQSIALSKTISGERTNRTSATVEKNKTVGRQRRPCSDHERQTIMMSELTPSTKDSRRMATQIDFPKLLEQWRKRVGAILGLDILY